MQILFSTVAMAVLFLVTFIPPPVQAAEAKGFNAKALNVEGVPVWLSEDHHLPIVQIRLRFAGAGAFSDTPEKQGRAALASAMLSEGAGDYDAQAFAELLESNAISYSASIDEDDLYISVQTLKKNLDTAMQLTLATLTNPHFDEEDFLRTQSKHMTMLTRLKESPSYQAAHALNVALYGDHPYARPAYGNMDSVAGLRVADMRAFTAERVNAQRLSMVIVGDVDEAAVSGKFSAYLRQIALGNAAYMPPEKAAFPAVVPEKPILTEMPVAQSEILFASRGVARNDPDFFAAYLLNHIVGGSGLTSKLSQAIRVEKGLVYGVGSGLQELRASALWVGNLATRKALVGSALETLKQTLRDISQQGVSAEELATAKAYVLGSLPLQLTSTSAKAAFLGQMQRQNLPIDYMEKREGLVNAVTLADVNRLAQTLLDPSGLFISIAGAVDASVEGLAAEDFPDATADTTENTLDSAPTPSSPVSPSTSTPKTPAQ